jgi:hypothetical protein
VVLVPRAAVLGDQLLALGLRHAVDCRCGTFGAVSSRFRDPRVRI